MEWVDLGLKRSDEYWEGQAAIVADRRSKNLRAGFHFWSRLAWSLRLAAPFSVREISSSLPEYANPCRWRVGTSWGRTCHERLLGC
jgi:hypothetical protein